MRRLCLLYVLTALATAPGLAQSKTIDSLRTVLAKHPQQDTFRVDRLNELADLFHNDIKNGNDSLAKRKSYSTATQALSLARRLNYAYGQVLALLNVYKSDTKQEKWLLLNALKLAQSSQNKALEWDVCNTIGYSYSNQQQGAPYLLRALTLAKQMKRNSKILESLVYLGNYYEGHGAYAQALFWFSEALKALKNGPDATQTSIANEATILTSISRIYLHLADYEQVLVYALRSQRAAQRSKNKSQQQIALITLGDCYRAMRRYPKAILAYEELLKDSTQNYYRRLRGSAALADVYERAGNSPVAFRSAFQTIALARQLHSQHALDNLYITLCRAYQKTNQPDSAFYYAHQALALAQRHQQKEVIRDASQLLATLYAQRQEYGRAYAYQSRYVGLKDSLNNEEVTRKATAIQFTDRMIRQQSQIGLLQKEKQLQAQEARRQRQLLYASFVVLALIGGLLGLLYHNNRQKQRANALLQAQRDQTQQALTELRATQNQLIQKEKLASLGELTAGIAHEIQNPLNFVNNFSEVSVELVDELKAGPFQKLPESEKEYAEEVLGDLTQNLQRITHHGDRASRIVKGMLEHSRTGTGERQPTDLNALADEYLRLAFQGQRAKNKDFQCTLVTEFDPTLGQVEVVATDIGRVLLNLLTNAFYAVTQQRKAGAADYTPTVWLSTHQKAGPSKSRVIEIRVADNGTGISESVKAKIFQPFFTTKPAGEGTGLGLSLSYDIITKGHQGSLQVNSEAGQGTQFVIQLASTKHSDGHA